MKNIIIVLLIFSLSGCTHNCRFTSIPHNSEITIYRNNAQSKIKTPAIGLIGVSTFKNNYIKIEGDGYEPFYSVVPSYVSARRIIMDIVLFTPLLFFNMRAAYKYYEIDLDKKCIKYRHRETQRWREYYPSKKLMKEIKEKFI